MALWGAGFGFGGPPRALSRKHDETAVGGTPLCRRCERSAIAIDHVPSERSISVGIMCRDARAAGNRRSFGNSAMLAARGFRAVASIRNPFTAVSKNE